MADIRSKLNALYSLEQLAAGKTLLHRIHPLAKLVVTLVYLICVMSLGRYELTKLTAFVIYPVILMAFSDIPWGMIFKRAVVAIPFCLFAGISNLIVDQNVMVTIGSLSITGGVLSFVVLIGRTLLCVSAVLILVALTPFMALMDQLRRLHVPELFVMLLEMVYRYIGVLLEESTNMITAFRLRSNGGKWPDIHCFGAFVGQLFLKSVDRAERIYQAMQCRLYTMHNVYTNRPAWTCKDSIFIMIGCGSSILFRCVNVPQMLGGVLQW